MSVFGNAKFGGGFVKRNRYKLKDGDNIYRILPPMGDLAEQGRWSAYYNVIFGFKTTDGKHRPFHSPLVKNNKTKMIEIDCAATSLIEKLKGQLEEAKKAGNKEKTTQLAKLVGDYPVMGVYSINRDHYINVLDLQGNVGQLELGHHAKLALENEIKRLNQTEEFKDANAISAGNGRFFNIRRTGKGRETQVQVTVVKEKINVPGVGNVEKDIVHVIDTALQERLCTSKTDKDGNVTFFYKEAANLDKLYLHPTSEEVTLIVQNADILTGKSAGIDQVFGKSKENNQATTQETADLSTTNQESVEEEVSELPQTTVEATKQTVTQATLTSVVQEAKTAVANVSEAPQNTTKTTAEVVAAMSPDEFMKQFGVNL